MIEDALGDARTVLNVGAGTGSYEPADREVTALEPSAEMIRQRPEGAAPAVQGSAEALPFADASFDAAMAVLTVHHWTDRARGLAEMRRVARDRVAILTFDPSCRAAWLLDYFPEFAAADGAVMPPMDAFADALGPVEVRSVAVPHDCTDGFLHAFWRRPHAYLDPDVRAGMSSFHALGDAAPGLARLKADLEDGTWEARHGHLLDREALDVGYRLVVAHA